MFTLLKCVDLTTTVINVIDAALNTNRDHRGRDRMVVGFTTTHAISAYHH